MWISKKKLEHLIEDAKSEGEFETWETYHKEREESKQNERLFDIEKRLKSLELDSQFQKVVLSASEPRREPKHACKCGR